MMSARGRGVMLGIMGLLIAGSGTPEVLHAQGPDPDRLAERIARAVEVALDRAGEATGRAMAALDCRDVRITRDEEWGWDR